jgi:Protein of unknown function (DUF559)
LPPARPPPGGTIAGVGRRNHNSSNFHSPSVDERILAAARHNVIEGRRLRELGLSTADIHYRVKVGRLFRRHGGVFAVGRPDLSVEGVFLASVLACGPRAVLSHRSAARLWGLRGGGTSRIDVTAPRSITPKPGIRLHRPLSLDALDTTTADGIPITSVAQTLLDVAAPAMRVDIGRVLHEASVQGLLDMREVWAVLARSPSAPGAPRLDRASREEHPFTRSGLERAALSLFRSSSVPEPECNAWVSDGEKLVEVDFLWRRARLIVEVDGSRYHSTRWRRRQDAAKSAALRAHGWKVLRFCDVDVAGSPSRVAAAIAAATSIRGPRK